MDAVVVREFGMKGRGQDAARADHDGIAIVTGQDLDLGGDLLDSRGAKIAWNGSERPATSMSVSKESTCRP
jgi:hypothetical protein